MHEIMKMNLGCRDSQRAVKVIRIKRKKSSEVVRIESGIDQSKLRRLELHGIGCVGGESAGSVRCENKSNYEARIKNRKHARITKKMAR